MATRIYLPSSGSPAVTPSSWIFTNQINPVTYAGQVIRASTTMTTKTEATGTTNPTTRAMLRYVVGPLAAQTISGTVRLQMRASESNAGANATLAIAVKIIQPGGADRATLLGVSAADSATSPYEFLTSLTNRKAYDAAETEPITLTSQSATAGDYLVIEIGFRSATATSRNISLSHGTDSASDLPADTTTTTADNPWVDFSNTIGILVSGTATISTSSAVAAQAKSLRQGISTIATSTVLAPTQNSTGGFLSLLSPWLTGGPPTDNTAAISASSIVAAIGASLSRAIAAITGIFVPPAGEFSALVTSAVPVGGPTDWDYIFWGGFPGTTLRVGNTLYFYFVGAQTSGDPDWDVLDRAIGVATSTDNGATWTKYASNPIVTYTTTGGVEQEEGASNPQVIRIGSTWHMWYAASRYTGPSAVDVDIRYRTSTDGITWTGDALVYSVAGEEHVPCGVFFDGTNYHLYTLGNLTGGKGPLYHRWGTTPTNLSNSELVLSGSWQQNGGLNELDTTTLLLALGDPTNANLLQRVNLRTINKATPGSTTLAGYWANSFRGGSPYFDKVLDRWQILVSGNIDDDFDLYTAAPGLRSSAVSSIGTAIKRAIATITGSTTFTGVGFSTAQAITAITASSTVSGQGATAGASVVTITGTSAVAGQGTSTADSNSAISTTSSIAAQGFSTAVSLGVVAAASSVAGQGSTAGESIAAVTGTSAVTGISAATTQAQAVVLTASAVAPIGSATAQTQAIIAATSAIAGVGQATHRATATITGTSTVAGQGQTAGTSVITASGVSAVLGIAASVAVAVGASVASSTCLAVGTSVARGVCAMAGSTSVVGVSHAIKQSTAVITSGTSIVGASQAIKRSTSAITTASTVQGYSTSEIANATILGTSTVAASGQSLARATGSSAGASSVVGQGRALIRAVVTCAGTAVCAGVGTSTARATSAITTTTLLAGVSRSTAVSTGTSASISAVVGASSASKIAASTIASASSVVAQSGSSPTGIAAISSTSTVAGVSRAIARSIGTSASGTTVIGQGRSTARSIGTIAGTTTVTAQGRAATRGVATIATATAVNPIGFSTARSLAALSSSSVVLGVSRAIKVSVGTVATSTAVYGTTSATAPGVAQIVGTSSVLGISTSIVRSTATLTGTTTVAGVSRGIVRVTGTVAGTSIVAGVGAARTHAVSTITTESSTAFVSLPRIIKLVISNERWTSPIVLDEQAWDAPILHTNERLAPSYLTPDEEL